jgi:hypothetical protein
MKCEHVWNSEEIFNNINIPTGWCIKCGFVITGIIYDILKNCLKVKKV